MSKEQNPKGENVKEEINSCDNCYWSNSLDECELDRDQTKDICRNWVSKEQVEVLQTFQKWLIECAEAKPFN